MNGVRVVVYNESPSNVPLSDFVLEESQRREQVNAEAERYHEEQQSGTKFYITLAYDDECTANQETTGWFDARKDRQHHGQWQHSKPGWC